MITPALLGVDAQDRADRRVELGVHQHDVLAVAGRLEHDLRAELDRAGEVDEHVDLLGAAEQERVVGDDDAVGADRVLDLVLAAVATTGAPSSA